MVGNLMQLLWILSSAVEEPFRLPLKLQRVLSAWYQFAVVEDDFCSAEKLPKKLQSISMERPLIRFVRNLLPIARITLKGYIDHRQAKYGYALSEDRRNLVLNPESAQVVKLIFQMYLEDMKIPEIANIGCTGFHLHKSDAKKKDKNKNQVPDSTIRSILKNPLYIGKCS